MLLNEFIERTGFRPSDECYEKHIEPMYNESDLTKDEWCKQWKRQDGVAKAYQWQVVFDTEKINDAKNETNHNAILYNQIQQSYEQLKMENKQLRDEKEDYRVDLEDCRKQLEEMHQSHLQIEDNIESMMQELIGLSERLGSDEIRATVILNYGFKSYIQYKLDNDLTLSELDRKEIMENLK